MNLYSLATFLPMVFALLKQLFVFIDAFIFLFNASQANLYLTQKTVYIIKRKIQTNPV